MPRRMYDIHIRLTREEAADLKRKAKICGISQSALIRILLKGYEPREKPGDRFFDVMRQMCAIGNSLNQIARKANSLGLFDAAEYKRQVEKFNQFQNQVEKEFFSPAEHKEKFR